jgi:hypothetical protein
MSTIKIPKQDRYIFLKAAKSLQLNVTRLKKIDDSFFDFYHCEKIRLSQQDLFLLGILYQQLKTKS